MPIASLLFNQDVAWAWAAVLA